MDKDKNYSYTEFKQQFFNNTLDYCKSLYDGTGISAKKIIKICKLIVSITDEANSQYVVEEKLNLLIQSGLEEADILKKSFLKIK